MRIMTIIKIVQKYGMKYPNSAVEGHNGRCAWRSGLSTGTAGAQF